MPQVEKKINANKIERYEGDVVETKQGLNVENERNFLVFLICGAILIVLCIGGVWTATK